MKIYNMILSVILIVVGAAGAIISRGWPVVAGNNNDPGAAVWPMFLCVALVVFAIILMIQSLLKKEDNETEGPLIDFKSPAMHCVLIIFADMILYAVLLYFFGFIIATMVFVVIVMLAIGERRPLVLVLTTVGITLGVYLLFAVLMGVVLPKPRLF